MNAKKIQTIFFSALIILSISSSLYLNFHVEPNYSSLMELPEPANEQSEKLMADIDAFKNIFKNVAKQIVRN